MSNDKKQVERMCCDFFAKMGLSARVEVAREQERTLPVRVEVDDPKLAIGQNGQTLRDIQHLLRIMARHHLPEGVFLDVDVNGYKRKKADYLHEVAGELADEAILSRTEKELPPMPSYERRIIHVSLAEHPNVYTESSGRGRGRRVIIKPY